MSLFRSTLENLLLVLLNGPPAAGKTTVAQRWVNERPLALNLDLDDVWLHLGRWSDDLTATGLAARQLALALCQAQLAAHRSVIVPQFLGRPDFIDQLAAVGGPSFRHLVLLPPLTVVRQRFADRGPHPIADHPDASTMAGDLDQMYDRLVALAQTRPDAEVIELTGHESIDDVLARINRLT